MTAPGDTRGRGEARGQDPEVAPAKAVQHLQMSDLLAQMSATAPGPAAGSAAAVAVSMAAALVAKTARLSPRHLQDAAALARTADAWCDRALELAGADASSVIAMLTADASRAPESPQTTVSPVVPVGAGCPDPSTIPRQIGELAEEVARQGARLSESGNPRLRADALAARHLAEAAGYTVDAIVRSNRGLLR